MTTYKPDLFVYVPCIVKGSREQKIADLERRIPNCPETIAGFKKYFPEQLEAIIDFRPIYDCDNPGWAYYQPGLYLMIAQQQGTPEQFDFWSKQYFDILDSETREDCKDNITEYNTCIRRYTQVYLQLMKPISTPHTELLELLRNVIYYQRYHLIMFRDQILEPIANCQKQFSLGTLVQ
jgi:hypothetical protein